jgi:hypothetical protein
MKAKKFPTSVVEKIGFYVYTLADPITGKIFYVGKGTGNRVFAHANAALRNVTKSDKLEKIRRIRAKGRAVRHEVVRHGMTQNEALEVESTLIDYIGVRRLSNEVAGHAMDMRGKMTTDEIIALYRAKPIKIIEPSLLIIVNQLFERNISPARLYEVTRGNWVLGPRRQKAQYAFSIYKGVVRQVYRIDRWSSAVARSRSQKRQERWRFRGKIASELQHYVGGSVERYLKRGAQSPVRYLNC